MQNWFVYLFALTACSTVGFYAGFLAGIGAFAIFATREKERTHRRIQAVVIRTSVAEAESHAGAYEENGPCRVYGPEVEYRYEVDGVTYTATAHEVFMGGSTKLSDRRWAERISNRFQVGQAAVAWYDPTDPSQAFLIRGTREYGVPFLLLTLGLTGLVGCGFFADSVGALIPCVVLILFGWGAVVLKFVVSFKSKTRPGSSSKSRD